MMRPLLLSSLLVLLNAMRLLWFERWSVRWPGRLENAAAAACADATDAAKATSAASTVPAARTKRVLRTYGSCYARL